MSTNHRRGCREVLVAQRRRTSLKPERRALVSAGGRFLTVRVHVLVADPAAGSQKRMVRFMRRWTSTHIGLVATILVTRSPTSGADQEKYMSAELTEVNQTTFESFVSAPHEVALIDFWAPWCGPCRTMGPVLDQISVEYAGRLRVGKVNVDVQPGLAARFGVRGIPTLVMFKDGQAVSQVVGAVPKTELTRWIDSLQTGQA